MPDPSTEPLDELVVRVINDERPEESTDDLLHWLRDARIAGLRAERRRGRGRTGDMGLVQLLDVTVIVSIVGASASLAQALHAWLYGRRRRSTMEIEHRGVVLRLSSEDRLDAEEVIARMRRLLASGDPA